MCQYILGTTNYLLSLSAKVEHVSKLNVMRESRPYTCVFGMTVDPHLLPKSHGNNYVSGCIDKVL